jgi:hypothetical protein
MFVLASGPRMQWPNTQATRDLNGASVVRVLNVPPNLPNWNDVVVHHIEGEPREMPDISVGEWDNGDNRFGQRFVFTVALDAEKLRQRFKLPMGASEHEAHLSLKALLPPEHGGDWKDIDVPPQGSFDATHPQLFGFWSEVFAHEKGIDKHHALQQGVAFLLLRDGNPVAWLQGSDKNFHVHEVQNRPSPW